MSKVLKENCLKVMNKEMLSGQARKTCIMAEYFEPSISLPIHALLLIEVLSAIVF